MNADEKLIEDLYPCRSWCRTVRYHGKHSCDCRFQERARARKLAARIRADAERETERLRKALEQADEAIMLALDMPGVSWCSPQRNAMEHARVAIDAALKGDA